jgi:hypothetical protein
MEGRGKEIVMTAEYKTWKVSMGEEKKKNEGTKEIRKG